MKMPNPTKDDVEDPTFNAVWDVIRTWDVNVSGYYDGYCRANGSHVMLILNEIRKRQQEYYEEKGLYKATIK